MTLNASFQCILTNCSSSRLSPPHDRYRMVSDVINRVLQTQPTYGSARLSACTWGGNHPVQAQAYPAV